MSKVSSQEGTGDKPTGENKRAGKHTQKQSASSFLKKAVDKAKSSSSAAVENLTAVEKGEDGVLRKKATKNQVGNMVGGQASKLKENFTSPLNVFSTSYYPEPDIPQDRVVEIVDDNNEVVGYDVLPKVTAPWKCEYYHKPQKKVRLLSHLAIAAVLVFMGLSAVFGTKAPGGVLLLIISLLLFFNILFRYKDIALYKIPMPDIPVLSNLDFNELFGEIREFMKTPEDHQKEYDEMVETSEKVEYVKPANRYRGDTPSPATILTNWMNAVAEWDEQDLIDNSDGQLDRFALKMLLKDDVSAWSDDDLVNTISEVTGSHPKQWREALSHWVSAVDNE